MSNAKNLLIMHEHLNYFHNNITFRMLVAMEWINYVTTMKNNNAAYAKQTLYDFDNNADIKKAIYS